jgi:hypothetical protein
MSLPPENKRPPERKGRETLRRQFRQGSLPSEYSFADLIESVLNITDDCFGWKAQNGVELRVQSKERRLLSFFRTPQQGVADWAVASDENSGSLHFVPGVTTDLSDPGALTLLSLDEGKTRRVGIGIAAPAYDLDVAGTIRCAGRIGTGGPQKGRIPADGIWHTISGELTGCHAFEVMAGVGGGAGKGRYSMLHATAMNTFSPQGWLRNFLGRKNRIRCQHAWYRSRADKLKLRWLGTSPHYYELQLKSNTAFPEGTSVQFSLTSLWFDESMAQSAAQSPPPAAEKTS